MLIPLVCGALMAGPWTRSAAGKREITRSCRIVESVRSGLRDVLYDAITTAAAGRLQESERASSKPERTPESGSSRCDCPAAGLDGDDDMRMDFVTVACEL